MVRILSVLFISSVFVFGFCKGESEKNKQLKLDIKTARANIASVIVANAKLSQRVIRETKLYKTKIVIKDDLKNRGSKVNQKQHKELEDLHQQLVESYLDEDKLKEVHTNIEKLKLAIQVTQENIKILEARRENGTANSCLELEGMTVNKTHNTKHIRVLSLVVDYEKIVLENQLRLLLTELEQAKNKQAELEMQLKSLHEFYNKYNKDLNEAYEKLGEDHKKGQESIDKIKGALEEQKKKVAELEKSAGTTKTELDKWKKEAKEVLEKFKIYALDVECYKKLHSDMVTMVTFKP